MIVSKRTFSVTIKYGEYNNNSQGYRVLANNISDAENIINEWISDQNFINPEIVSVTQTGDILVREVE
jgi:hypothetical protein